MSEFCDAAMNLSAVVLMVAMAISGLAMSIWLLALSIDECRRIRKAG